MAGYGLSALSKLLMAFSIFPLVIYVARLSDRLGKGIRSSPRDGLLGAEATEGNVGKIFGFHRSMDTLGAAIGPCITLLLLYELKKVQQQPRLMLPGLLKVQSMLKQEIQNLQKEIKISQEVQFQFRFLNFATFVVALTIGP